MADRTEIKIWEFLFLHVGILLKIRNLRASLRDLVTLECGYQHSGIIKATKILL